MGKSQSKSYDFTGGGVKKSGSKKANGVEARKSTHIDPDQALPVVTETKSSVPATGNGQSVTNSENSVKEEETKGEDTTTDADVVEKTDVKDQVSKEEELNDLNKDISQEKSETVENSENKPEEIKSEQPREERKDDDDVEKSENKEKPEENITTEESKEEEILQENKLDENQSPDFECVQSALESEPVQSSEVEDKDQEENPTEQLTTEESEVEDSPKVEKESQISSDAKDQEESPELDNQLLKSENTAESPTEVAAEEASEAHIVTISIDKEAEEIQEEDNMADTVEAVVCSESDLQDGEMREFDVGEGKVLVVREGGNYHALGAKCTHYGAPLVNGSHCKGRIRCPWHGACFNVKTGDIEDFPGLDSIPKFKVDVNEGKIKVTAKKSALTNHKVQKSMCKVDPDNDKKVLIIGGEPKMQFDQVSDMAHGPLVVITGASSVKCAETLRQEGFTGSITIATQENNIPYDRPKLSKAMDVDAKSIALRDEEFYSKADINILKQKQATGIDTAAKTVTFKDGSTESYTSLVLATGGRPRVLPIPGVDLQNVCQLRTPEDANTIAAQAKGKNVVIIGSSFIGMEVAACLSDKAKSVTVLVRGQAPLQNCFGLTIGDVIRKMHEDNGVKFYFERGIKEFVGSDGVVMEAILSDDTRLPADLCILGVGVVPATDFIKDSGIDMTDRGFIPVNKMMQTSQPDIYATGDIVEFPLFSVEDKSVNIQHWQMAHAHGKTAALGILGRDEPIRSIPYFWTVQYKKSIRYTGYGPGYDDIIVHGDLDAPKFIAYYTKGEEVVAAASLNFDPFVSRVADMMLAGEKILKNEVQSDADGWMERFVKLSSP